MTGGVARRTRGSHHECSRSRFNRLCGDGGSSLERRQRHVANGKQSMIHGAELGDATVVGTGHGFGQHWVLGFGGGEEPRRKRVEHQLALYADEVHRRRSVVSQEAAGGRIVLSQHDLRRILGAIVSVVMAERASIHLGLAMIIDQLVPQQRHPAAPPGVGVGAQPVRRLHDVCVGIVGHPFPEIRHGRRVRPLSGGVPLAEEGPPGGGPSRATPGGIGVTS